MGLFGLGSRKDKALEKKVAFRAATAQQASAANLAKNNKSSSASKANSDAQSTFVSPIPADNRNIFAPAVKMPGDAAFINSMGEVNQPSAVYQQHLARQWQHKALERNEMQAEASLEHQTMTAPQTHTMSASAPRQQWPLMPVQFTIEHFDFANTRYHTMFTHLGLGPSFFKGTIWAYNTILGKYCSENKKNKNRLTNADWRAVGERVARAVNHELGGEFKQLVRLDYSFSDVRRTGNFILTYPLRPEDAIAWCEIHKVPYLTEEGLKVWEEHKLQLRLAE